MKPNEAKPNLVMHEIYMHLLALGFKSDWTVLSADKAERKMGIKLLLGSDGLFWCHQNIWKWYEYIYS